MRSDVSKEPTMSRRAMALRLVLITVGLLTLVLGVSLSFMVSGCLNHNSQLAEERSGPVYLRDEFSQMIMGKREQDVLAAIGQPDRTSKDSDALYWHYRYRTKDPITQNT